MKTLIQWAVRNGPAMNTMMIAIIVIGALSMGLMRREVFPQFELEIILVTVPYPGASPEEVEDGICQKIEEAVRSLDGIKKQTAIAREGAGFLVLELETGVNVQKTLNEVRSEIDGIPSFPELAEEPDVKQITFRLPAIRVGVLAEESDDPLTEVRLRDMAERVREDLLELPSVSQANILAARNFQIDVEISEDTLRKHGLSLQQVSEILRRENVELPSGSIKTDSEEVLLRGKNKHLVGAEIAKLPILQTPSGDVLTVDDLGTVRDEFVDETSISLINGRPGMAISVDRTRSEDLLRLCQEVREYVRETKLPGYELTYWSDESIDVEDRMQMLLKNGFQGLVLVFLVLSIFLDLKLAFWVALGIPISVLGSGAVLMQQGQTLNMLSMFSFLMALGIVVDDAIVIGENIYRHREMGKGYVRAAIDGTYEVLPSVTASVCTTVIAFVPLMFVSGVMGKFIAVMPLAVIAMLVISLIESTFILPCHLSHPDSLIFSTLNLVFYPFRFLKTLIHWLNRWASEALTWLIENTYVPTLRWALDHQPVVYSCAVSLLLIAGAFVASGITPWVLFPKLDSRSIEARVVYPDGTPASVTAATTVALEEAIGKVTERFKAQGDGGKIINVRYTTVGRSSSPDDPTGQGGDTMGSHLGSVELELVPVERREVTSDQLLQAWREEWQANYASRYPGTESLSFRSREMGPGGKPIEFKLLAPATTRGVAQLEAATQRCKERLAEFQGVFDVDDDSRPGKLEYQLRVKDTAQAMGVTLADLAETVRAAYYGSEVMRLQRGRHEVKLMVRYPRDERRSLASIGDIRVRLSDGAERPLMELADIQVTRGYSEINRVDQQRSITIMGDVDIEQTTGGKVIAALKGSFMDDLLRDYPLVRVRWEGQQEQSEESIRSLMVGLVIAILAMFALLTVEFRSYLQPILILVIIPFGFVGAVLGHALLGLDFTLFSVFGMIALTGVVVNDSIVLIDFINHEIESGTELRTALIEAGRRRFRPVVLTSVTTVAGLTPMLLETSFQAQVLIPMATSLCFGLMVATALILVMVPVSYEIYALVSKRHEEFADSGETVHLAKYADREAKAEQEDRQDVLVQPG